MRYFRRRRDVRDPGVVPPDDARHRRVALARAVGASITSAASRRSSTCLTESMIVLVLQGHSSRGGRDLTIDAMNAAARRLTVKYPADVSAVRYRDGWHEVDSFMVWTGPVDAEHGTAWHGPTLLVPVRRRLCIGRFRRGWHELQPVPEAASEVGRSVRPRPN